MQAKNMQEVKEVILTLLQMNKHLFWYIRNEDIRINDGKLFIYLPIANSSWYFQVMDFAKFIIKMNYVCYPITHELYTSKELVLQFNL